MTEIDYARVGGYGPESLPGHSGSETSEAAARRPGIGRSTMEVHELLKAQGERGFTAEELGDHVGRSHGSASGALSRLHRAGLIARLNEKRGTMLVYVDSAFVNGRECSQYRPNAAYREDRKPMALERPEPTLKSVTEDLMAPTPERRAWFNSIQAKFLAPIVLEIVRKYR